MSRCALISWLVMHMAWLYSCGGWGWGWGWEDYLVSFLRLLLGLSSSCPSPCPSHHHGLLHQLLPHPAHIHGGAVYTHNLPSLVSSSYFHSNFCLGLEWK